MALDDFKYGGPSYAKVTGSWKKIIDVYQKVAGAWEKFQAIYNKVDDTWHVVHAAQTYPEDALALFDSDFTKFDHWVDFDFGGRLPRLKTEMDGAARTGGSETHGPHGPSLERYTDYVTATKNVRRRTTGSNGYVIRPGYQSHRHLLPVHSHPDAASNIPESLEVKAYTGVGTVWPGMLLLWHSPTVPNAEWEAVDTNRYLAFTDSNPGGTIGSNSHNHGNVQWETATYTFPVYSDTYKRGASWNRTHTHRINEDSERTMEIYYKSFYLMRAVSPGIEVPSGGMLLGHPTMKSVPDGYTFIAGSAERPFVRVFQLAETPPAEGGQNPIHKHISCGANVLHGYISLNSSETQQTENEEYKQYSHQHTGTEGDDKEIITENWAHTHPEEDGTPPFIEVPLIQKD